MANSENEAVTPYGLIGPELLGVQAYIGNAEGDRDAQWEHLECGEPSSRRDFSAVSICGALGSSSQGIDGSSARGGTSDQKPNLDLALLTEQIMRHKQRAADCHDSDSIVVLGDTGAGKSTRISSVLGCKVEWTHTAIKVGTKVLPKAALMVENRPKTPKVGIDKTKSMTQYLGCYPDPEVEDLFWLDTPGYEDTRGIEVAIANSVATAHILRCCKSVRLVLLLPVSALESAKGALLRNVLERTRQLIAHNFVENLKSLMVFFTLPGTLISGEEMLMEKYVSLYEYFEEFIQNPEPGTTREALAMVKHILELLSVNAGDLILQPDKPGMFKDLVLKMLPIASPSQTIRSPLNAHELKSLMFAGETLSTNVREALWCQNFTSIEKDLCFLKQVCETSALETLGQHYSDSVSHIVESFHANLRDAEACLKEKQFKTVRGKLGNVPRQLFTYTEAFERSPTRRTRTAEGRREIITRAINDVAENLATEGQLILDNSLNGHLPQLASIVGTLKDLVDELASELTQENKTAYTKLLKQMETSIIYNRQRAIELIAQDKLHVGSGLQDLMHLLRDSVDAFQPHYKDCILDWHSEAVRKLEERSQAHANTLNLSLAEFESTTEVVFPYWKQRLDPTASFLRSVQEHFSDQVCDHISNLYSTWTCSLERFVRETCERLESSLAAGHRCDYCNVKQALLHLDLVAQISVTDYFVERFKNEQSRVSDEVSKMILGALELLPAPDDPGNSYSFATIAKAILTTQAASRMLGQYLEDGRRPREALDSDHFPNWALLLQEREIPRFVEFVLDQLKHRAETHLEVAASALEGGRLSASFAGAIAFVGPMWPLHEVIPDICKTYKTVADELAVILRRAYDEGKQRTEVLLEPDEAREALKNLEASTQMIEQGVQTSWDVLATLIGSSSAEILGNLSMAKEVACENLIRAVEQAEGTAKKALAEGNLFEARQQFCLLTRCDECLAKWIKRRGQTSLQCLVHATDEMLSSYETKFRHAIEESDLSEAERIVATMLKPMEQLRDYLPRTEILLKSLSKELDGQRDGFVKNVQEMLHNKDFSLLNACMHGARRALKGGSPADNKKWIAALGLITSEVRSMCEEALAIVRVACSTKPLRIDETKYSDVAKVLNTMNKFEQSGNCDASLSSLLPDWEEWSLQLKQHIQRLMDEVKKAGEKALKRCRFVEVAKVQENLDILWRVPIPGMEFEGDLGEFNEKVEARIQSLPAYLAAMASPNHVSPTGIDRFFRELCAAEEVDDFAHLFGELLNHLETCVKEYYTQITNSLKDGHFDSAEQLLVGAEKLQSCTTVKDRFSYIAGWHATMLKDFQQGQIRFISKRMAKLDPSEFRKRLDSLRDVQPHLYDAAFVPFKAKLIEAAADLQKEVRQLPNVNFFTPGQLNCLQDCLGHVVEQPLYAEAIQGHGEDELKVGQLVEDLKSSLDFILKKGQDSLKRGQMREADCSRAYISKALECLDKSGDDYGFIVPKVPYMSDILSLGELIRPRRDLLSQKLSDFQNHAEVEWQLVANFDIFSKDLQVKRIALYLRNLRDNGSFLNSSLLYSVPRKAAIDHAVDLIRGKISACEIIDLNAEAPMLVCALRNLDELTRELPLVSTDASTKRTKLVTFLLAELARLEDDTTKLFEQIMRSDIGVCDSSAMKTINAQLEESTRLRGEFASVPEIGRQDAVVGSILQSARQLHERFMLRDTPPIDEVAEHFIMMFSFSSFVSNKDIGAHVRKLVEEELSHLKRTRKVNIIELGKLLVTLGPMGNELVVEFTEFKSVKTAYINERLKKCKAFHFDEAVKQLQKTNPDMPLCNLERLRVKWEIYTVRFDHLVDKYCFRGSQNVIEWVKGEMIAFRGKARGDARGDVAAIVAGICAAVALELSETCIKKDSELMMRPHPIQVLAIFRLLRVDVPSETWLNWAWKKICSTSDAQDTAENRENPENHICQIRTGEGKSIVLAVVNIFLALWGFTVNCACYSKYLSDRDYDTFKELFSKFGVDSSIFYQTFSDLARNHVDSNGDVREGAKALIEDTLIPGSIAVCPTEPKILILDEVDVFFSPDFFGETYKPTKLIQSFEITELISEIWNQRGATLTMQSVQASVAYERLKARYYPKLEALFEAHIQAMILATSTFSGPNHAYKVFEGKIGYDEHGTVNTTFVDGYNTTFAYFLEKANGRIDKNIFDENVGLYLRCGSFSYAQIPLQFSRILGVTGTLPVSGSFEDDVIKNFYHIKQRTVMPSMYGIADAGFDLGVHLETNKEDYFRKIQDDVQNAAGVGRAVLVFFETEQRLREFVESEYGKRLGTEKSDFSCVTSEKVDVIRHYVRQATRSKEITLFTRIFGRGLDFICHDDLVKAMGGTLVLQTFFSEDISEEIQIKGRTCRQGDRGNYKMILLSADLLNWNQLKAGRCGRTNQQQQKAASVQESFVSEEELKGKQLYDLLDERRRIWCQMDSGHRRMLVSRAKDLHNAACKFQSQLRSGSPQLHAEMVGHLTSMAVRVAGFNIVFCLDESGSMVGKSWAQLTEAFKQFVCDCVKWGGGEDNVCVIQFNQKARITISVRPLDDPVAMTLSPPQGGGTCFAPALQQATTTLKAMSSEYPGKTPLLIFMTDGVNEHEDVDWNPQVAVQLLVGQLDHLAFHAVYFGVGSGHLALKAMVETVSGGHFHHSVDGVSLARTFEGIASELAAL